ncbi:MAG TPA: FAD-binding oxidoreductase [Thermomicrobiaceae bacterium]|nr:FAD-binding oxidoreductase [Thermomicrobiaceae bacterium]
MSAEQQDADRFAVDGVRPERVVRPESVAELREIVREAAASESPLIPWGGGTQMGFGNLAGPTALALDLTGLNQVVDYEPDDLTIGIQAGATVGAANELLGQNGQFLPAEAADPARATLGGVFATGIAGPRRFGFGSPRDMVLGISLVLPDGTLARGGGKVVKNVSGFDLMRLNYGALGSLGIIVQLNLKVLPAARAQRTVLARYADLAPALEAAMRVRESTLGPTAITLVDAGAARAAELGDAAWTLALRCEAPPEAVTRQADRVREEVASGALDSAVLEDAATQPTWLALNGALSAEPARAWMNVRLGVTPSQAAVALEACGAAAIATGLALERTADLGSGLIYARLNGTNGMLLGAWRGLAHVGSHRSLLSAPPAVKAETDVFGARNEGFPLMEALKEQFDPGRIFNRGRFIGRL